MAHKNPQVDNYILKAEEFAQPILNYIRDVVHLACPGVEEKMKWSFPHFDYKGSMCSMASFKQHCAFGFWKASLINDKYKLFSAEKRDGMGHLGKIKSLNDLPSDKILMEYIKQAAKLNEQGIKLPPKKTSTQKEIIVPDYFLKALSKNKNALKTFSAFSPSHRKEYVEWITEAKTEETKNKRISTALEWLEDGKIRNWKYLKK